MPLTMLVAQHYVDLVKQVSFVGEGYRGVFENIRRLFWELADWGSDVHSRLHMSTAALLDAIDAQPPPHPPILACIVIDAYPLQGTNRPPHMHSYWCDLATTGNKSRCLSIDRGQHNLINDRISVRMIIFY